MNSATRPRATTACVVGAALLLGACAAGTGGSEGRGGGLLAGFGSGQATQQDTARDNKAVAAETGQSDRVAVGRRKEVALATFEGDVACTRLVAPFDVTDNAGELLSMATDTASSSLKTWLDQWLVRGGRQAADQTLAQAKHQIPIEMRTRAMRMNWLPMKAEVMYGEMLLEQAGSSVMSRTERQGKLHYPKADAMLGELLASLGEPHDYKFQLFLVKRPGENAVALPGGLILVDADLITKAELHDKARFALSHEVAHVLQRHQTRALQARIIDTISLRGGLPDLVRGIQVLRTDPKPLLQVVIAGKLQFERHSAVQELHSDSCGARIADRALKNPRRLSDVLKAYIDRLPPPDKAVEGPDGRVAANAGRAEPGAAAKEAIDNLVVLVSRPVDQHPSSAERIDNLNRIAASLLERLPATAARKPVPPQAGKLDPKKVDPRKPVAKTPP